MKRWETWAIVSYGDHGMAALRDNKANVGYLELVKGSMRWVPQEGEGWSVPLDEVSVLSPRTLFNRPSKGIMVSHPKLGQFRIIAAHFAPGMVADARKRYMTETRKSGKLRTALLARGAHEATPDD